MDRVFFEQSAYTVAGSGLQKLLHLAVFVILTRTLSSSEIGMLGVSLGYIVLLNYFVIHPEGILLKRGLRERDREVSAFVAFWAVRSLALVGLGFVLALWLGAGEPLLGRFFLLFAVLNCTNQLSDIFNFTLFMHYRHRFTFFANTALSSLSLALSLLLFVFPGLMVYGFILLAVSILRALVHFFWWRRVSGFRFDFSRNMQILKKNIRGFSLWNHLNAITILGLFYLDTVVLHYFSDLPTIGDYTVALKIAFVAFELASILERPMCLSFQGITAKRALGRARSYSGYAAIGSLAALGAYFAFGKMFLVHVFRVQDVLFSHHTGLILLGSVAVINTAKPYLSFAICRLDLRRFFLYRMLPALLAAITLSVAFTAALGPTGTALANIPSYALFLFLTLGFCKSILRKPATSQ